MNMVSGMKRMKRAMDYVTLCTIHFLLKPVARMRYGGRNIWIVCERGTDARDNGYHFFRYVCENHPEQKIYYIIRKDSTDYPKVAALGNVAAFGSLRHWLLYLGADVKISTHINGFLPNKNWHYQRYASKRSEKERVVFLRHGIGKDRVEAQYRKNTNVNLFFCGAKAEYDYVLAHYGYSEKELKYVGLARFDNLCQFQSKRQILIMPTWRTWLSSQSDKVTMQAVVSSEYCRRWSAFLKNEQLSRLAAKYNVTFIFYPHYEIQPYLHLFQQTGEHVTIADFAHYDVQQLLKESMLLITDYSSVFFDFAYMRKPTLYYQFDEAEYRAHHYQQGYFDYRRDGFGEVVTEEEKLLDLLEQYLEEGCRPKPVYEQRIQSFFPLHDDKNCERIYNEIRKLT